MRENELQILIQAAIDQQVTIPILNKQIARLQNKVNALKLNVEINDKVLTTLKSFSEQMKKIGEVSKDAGKYIKEVTNPDGSKVKETFYDGLNGAFKRTTTEAKNLNEEVKDLNQAIDNSKIEDLTKDFSHATKENVKLNESLQELQKNVTAIDNTGTKTRTVGVNNSGNVTGIRDSSDLEKIPKLQDSMIHRLDLLYKKGDLTARQFERLKKAANTTDTVKGFEKLQNILDRLKIRNDLIAQKEKLRDRLRLINREGRLSANELQRLNTAINSSRNIRELDKVKSKLGEVQGVLKNVGMMEQLKVAMSRIPIWMVGMSAFYAPLRAMQDAVSQIIQIDSQITTLKRVSGGMIDNSILSESVDLAERLGNTIIQINEGLGEFARQGFRGEGLLAMTEAATMFSNISEMSVEEAGSGLTAIINGYKMLPEEVMRAVDAINEVKPKFSLLFIVI